MQTYFDPRRANDPHALPNCEIWYHDGLDDDLVDDNGEPLSVGYYWQACFPGCFPASDPIGPYETEADALAAAR